MEKKKHIEEVRLLVGEDVDSRFSFLFSSPSDAVHSGGTAGVSRDPRDSLNGALAEQTSGYGFVFSFLFSLGRSEGKHDNIAR